MFLLNSINTFVEILNFVYKDIIMKSSSLIYAIDQGTSSSRVIVFRTSDWEIVASHQVEFDSLYPEEGWCEQDPLLLLQTVKEVI